MRNAVIAVSCLMAVDATASSFPDIELRLSDAEFACPANDHSDDVDCDHNGTSLSVPFDYSDFILLAGGVGRQCHKSGWFPTEQGTALSECAGLGLGSMSKRWGDSIRRGASGLHPSALTSDQQSKGLKESRARNFVGLEISGRKQT